ncbi:hypothetical protein MKW92_032862 [Papaver armeniacum]|nr:hypothetical protein MKW92_032862 [Papaver armeniacum]
MINLQRTIYRSHIVISSSISTICCFKEQSKLLGFQLISRRTIVRGLRTSSNGIEEKSPYDTLERDADEEKIKFAYRRLAKFYHPDVYNGSRTLEEGETAETRFINIQVAYEFLIDDERRIQYDREHRVNPVKVMDWLAKKRTTFDQRGDMAVAAWAEQQQHELNVHVWRLSRTNPLNGANFPSTNFGQIRPSFVRNKFSDDIPQNIGNLSALESLDLSSNKLLGHIPLYLTTIDTLGVLNFSYNNLSGRKACCLTKVMIQDV